MLAHKPTQWQRWPAWTPEEDEVLRVQADGTHGSYTRIALRLGRTVSAVRHRAMKLGVAPTRPGRTKWTPERDDLLSDLYPRLAPATVARKMGLSYSAVTNRAFVLGLRSQERDGWYSSEDVAAMFGVERHWVGKRIEWGRLKATRTVRGMWRIEAADLRDFLRHYPREIHGRNVDMVSLVELLAGVVSG